MFSKVSEARMHSLLCSYCLQFTKEVFEIYDMIIKQYLNESYEDN